MKSFSLDSMEKFSAISTEEKIQIMKQLQGKINELRKSSEVREMNRLKRREHLKMQMKEMIAQANKEATQRNEKHEGRNIITKNGSDNFLNNGIDEYNENLSEKEQKCKYHNQKQIKNLQQKQIDRLRPNRDMKTNERNYFAIASIDTLRQSGLFNTRTIHMHAIAVAYEYTVFPTTKKLIWSWLMALVSFFVIFLQVFITYPIYIGVFQNTCATHGDCAYGSYCDAAQIEFGWRQPRCNACFMVDWDEYCPSNIFMNQEMWTMNVEQLKERIWFDADFTPNIYFDLDLDDIDLFTICSSKQYCEGTYLSGMQDSNCPQLTINKVKTSIETIVSILFVCILFATSLCADMKEADIEHQLLDFVLNQAHESSLHFAYIIRLSNRIRRYYLPLITILGGTSIILSEELSSKNILLNLVTILFLLEADNQIATFFLSPSQFYIGDKLVKFATESGDCTLPPGRPTLYALLTSMIMMFSIFYMDSLIKVLASDRRCSGFDNAILLFTFIMFFILLPCQAILTYFIDKSNHSFAKCFLQLSRMHAALYLYYFSNSFTLFTATSTAFYYYDPIAISTGIIASTCAGVRPSFILKYDIKRSFKNYIIDIAVIASWVAIQYWALIRIMIANRA